MSQENVEVVQALVDAWNAGDMNALRELLDPDVVLRPVSDWPEPGPYLGREAGMGFYERLREAFDADTIEMTSDLIHAADRVVGRWIWHAQGHGPESNMELTTVFTVRNGKVREAEYFWDHNDALDAAGLSE